MFNHLKKERKKQLSYSLLLLKQFRTHLHFDDTFSLLLILILLFFECFRIKFQLFSCISSYSSNKQVALGTIQLIMFRFGRPAWSEF